MIITLISIKEQFSIDTNNPQIYFYIGNLLDNSYNNEIYRANMIFKISDEKRRKIINYLKSLNAPKEVNRVIAFFSRLTSDECIYFLPMSVELEFIELYQESLKYYNEKFDEDYVLDNMKAYVEFNKKLDELYKKYNKDYYGVYHRYSKKVYLGESNRKKRKCIFCGGTKEIGNTFRLEAHAIPESLGNKHIIQNEECDECNQFFGKTIEPNFIEFIGMFRTICGLKKKDNKIPKTELYDGKYIDYIESEEFTGPIIIDNKGNEKFNLKETTDVIFSDIYKLLVKITISVLEAKYRNDFVKAIRWVRLDEIDSEKLTLPKLGIFYSENIFKQPEVITFIRQNDDKELPYCYSEIRIGILIFVCIIPFSEKDNGLITAKEFKYFWDTTIYKEQNFSFYDCSNQSKVKLDKNITINIKEINL